VTTSFETSNSNKIQLYLALSMELGGHCTMKVRVMNVDDMKGAPIAVSSPQLLALMHYKPFYEMDGGIGASTLGPSHAFIRVEVTLEGKRVGS
jgi:hypothetical protein